MWEIGTIQQYRIIPAIPLPELFARFQFPTQVSDLFRDGTQRALPQSLFHLAFMNIACDLHLLRFGMIIKQCKTIPWLPVSSILHYQWRSKPQSENRPSRLAVVCVWPNIWSLDTAQLHKHHLNLASLPCQRSLWYNNPANYLLINKFNRDINIRCGKRVQLGRLGLPHGMSDSEWCSPPDSGARHRITQYEYV